MDQNEIRRIVEQIVLRMQNETVCSPCASHEKGDIPLEVSARHVHLTREAVETLFGPGETLRSKRPLSQPGQFLSDQRVRLVTQKGSLDNVAVLGPERSKVQCELSLSDCRALGIQAPVNLSGNLAGAGDVILVGPAGVLEAKGSVIVAKAHIHLTPAAAESMGLHNDQQVSVRIRSDRPVVLEDVSVRVSCHYAPAMHIDHDEANACGCRPDTAIEILGASGKSIPVAAPEKQTLPGGVITEALAVSLLRRSEEKEIRLRKGSVLTPSAKDVFLHGGKTVAFL